MSNGNGHRWLKFWPQDWQNHPELKLCSLAAQAVWIRLLCMMHDGNGELLVNGVQPTDREIAIITTVPEKQVKRCIAELLARGVARRNDVGTLFCQRMCNDFAASEEGKRWGKKGGNPALSPQGGLTPPVNHKRANGVNPDPYPPPLEHPLTQNLEAEEEAEVEEEKKEVLNITSLSSYQLPARAHEARQETEPDDDEIEDSRDDYDALHDVPTLAEIERARAAFAAELDATGYHGKMIRAAAAALRMELPRRPYGPVRSPAAQIALLNPQPEIADAAGLKWQPAEPARSPAQQLAQLLGIPVDEAESRFAARAVT